MDELQPHVTSTFNLVRVVPAAASKTLDFEFFDAGDAASGGTIKVLPPTETPITLTGCTGTGKVDRTLSATARSPGCRARAGWNGKSQHIKVPIPATYTCNAASAGGCWFRLRSPSARASRARHDDLGRQHRRRPGPADQVGTTERRTAAASAQDLGGSMSAGLSSSTLTSLKVSTLTFLANRAGRYMSHTHASVIDTSKNTSPASVRAFTSTWLHR